MISKPTHKAKQQIDQSANPPAQSGLPKRYNPRTAEPRLQAFWQASGTYDFAPEGDAPVFSIDTPPATVSGHLHLGHCYSYSHTDFIARFRRMMGHNVFYPMGFDDNGLPTGRLVEKWEGVRATDVGRDAFIQLCLQISEKAEADYEALWRRLGLSIDWHYTYRTIDELSRRTAQLSFLDLYRKGLAYRKEAPTIWCPECGTAIAQAELDDLERQSLFFTLSFQTENGPELEIATTRPELLPACVAVFVHPDDARFTHLVGQRARVPHFRQQVPILADPGADPEKGTGVVMCCTFGDTADVAWWHTHKLPLRIAIDRNGRMTDLAGAFAALPVPEARKRVVAALETEGSLREQRAIEQSVRVHERCDTPVEYVVAPQWFVRVLDRKEELLEAGTQVKWHPGHMQARYTEWVKNLDWDWCISRQRAFGVPFPVWTCEDCGEVLVADEEDLPLDPTETSPSQACACGAISFQPDKDVMDTWATSSLSPQIAGRWLAEPQLYEKVFPFSLRPQAHEIIRTWAFYTIVKSIYHFGALPWGDVAISGWGIAPQGAGKISKSRGGGPVAPMEMIERSSADAVRYWAASAGPGRDAIIDEDKIQMGSRLVTKLWNVARFSQRFLVDYAAPPPAALADAPPPAALEGAPPPAALEDAPPAVALEDAPHLSPADRWVLARAQRLVRLATDHFLRYDYAAARSETETFFWRDLADNYLEMVKVRLYGEPGDARAGACYTFYHVLLAVLKLFAPILPYVTEEIYQGLFAVGRESIHRSPWPEPDPRFQNEEAEAFGETLVAIATTVRRYKSEHSLPLGAEIALLQLATGDAATGELLRTASLDIESVTRARQIEVVSRLDDGLEALPYSGEVRIGLGLD